MTRDDIIRMAREAKLEHFPDNWGDGWWHANKLETLERFAALVAAHTLSNIDPSSFMSYQEGFAAGAAAEREACADWVEDDGLSAAFGERSKYRSHLAAAIRARGETK